MKQLYCILIALFFLFPQASLAHIDGNALEDGDYRVELGSFPEEDLQPGETILFSTVMENLEAEPVYKTKAWVRISQNDQILFSSADFTTDDGTIDFEYLFPRHGQYEMTIRMINTSNDDEATVTFPLQIGDESLVGELTETPVAQQKDSRFNLAALTLIIGLLSGVFIARYRPKVNEVK